MVFMQRHQRIAHTVRCLSAASSQKGALCCADQLLFAQQQSGAALVLQIVCKHCLARPADNGSMHDAAVEDSAWSKLTVQ